jgi:hypothetical protein
MMEPPAVSGPAIGESGAAPALAQAQRAICVRQPVVDRTGKALAGAASASRQLRALRALEQVTYNMLFRCFIGLAKAAPVWDDST